MYKPKNRWQAFCAHLGISFIIFVTLLTIIIWQWYPGKLINMGGWSGIMLIAGVDLVIGPLLTLLIYRVGKNGLAFDLTIIAILQALCLTYGTWMVNNQRVVAQVILDDKLHIVTKSQLSQSQHTLAELKEHHQSIPPLVFLDLPEDRDTIITFIATSELMTGLPATQIQRYINVEQASKDAKIKERLDWRLSRLEPDVLNNCHWIPVESGHFKGRACIDHNGIQHLEAGKS